MQQPLLVQFGPTGPEPANDEEAICRIDTAATPANTGHAIADCLQKADFDALWIDRDGAGSLQPLLLALQTPELRMRCRLRTVVYCANDHAALHRILDGEADVRAALAQCDLLAVEEMEPHALRRLRRQARAAQPNLEVIPLANSREIASLLSGANPVEALRFFLTLAVSGSLLLLLGRLGYSIADTVSVFLGTYLQALPFLLLGILLSSAIQVFVPAGFLQRVFPKNLFGGMLFGVLGGFVLPVCDCASIPVFRSLVRKGVPLPAAVTFMISAPIINPVVLLSTYYAFGGNVRIMLARMGFGIVCSVLIGLLFSLRKQSVFKPNEGPTCTCCHAHTEESAEAHPHAGEDCGDSETATAQRFPRVRLRLIEWLTHFREEFFEVAKFLLIGIGVSTVLQTVLGKQLQTMQFDGLLIGMLAMMMLAFLLSLCSSSDAVVGKNMGASLPMGAVMAFLVFGPMMDIKNLILMSSSFTKRFMVELLLATFGVSFLCVYIAFSLGLGGMLA
ncbi:MAG: permease [Candidatus Limiplasma sp.]|nr:permease [Candidatus Limiplasma sp.]